jgi:hypothetical protein
MPRFIFRFVTLSILCASGAFGQGTFGQIAYGGCWQTTFTLVNLSSQGTASVSLFFYGDDGSPLGAPVQGIGNVSSYIFTIPAGGAQNVVLSNSDTITTQGWASMSTGDGATVRGQGSFRCHLSGRPDFEAVVPLSTPGSTPCIIPFPPQSNPVILVPFDNTASQYTTSLALANITSAALAVPLEFDDQFNQLLAMDTLNLAAMQHTAFATTDKYPAVAGKKGILRIQASTANLTILGLLFNATGPFTTIIPVTQ